MCVYACVRACVRACLCFVFVVDSFYLRSRADSLRSHFNSTRVILSDLLFYRAFLNIHRGDIAGAI